MLDDYRLANDVRPAFIKIDVEGFEAHVLRGAERVTASLHPDYLVEIHGGTNEANEASALAVVDWFVRRGYRCTQVESGLPLVPATVGRALRGHVIATAGSECLFGKYKV